MRKQALILMAALVMVMLSMPAGAAPVQKGEALPAITVKDLDGNDISINTMMGTPEKPGKKTLLVFFNTSCSLCLQELGDLKNLVGKGPEVIAVGIDIAGPEAVKRFVQNRNYGFTVVSDAAFETGSALGFGFTPASALFDEKGILIQKYPGYKEAQKKEIHDLF